MLSLGDRAARGDRGDLCADEEVGVEACATCKAVAEAESACAGKPGWENTSHRYELRDNGCAKTPSSWDVYSATGWHDMDRLLSCCARFAPCNTRRATLIN